MKNFKIKIEETKNNDKCEWKYSSGDTSCWVEHEYTVNGKKYCHLHFSFFEDVNRQFKILEEIEVEI